MKVNSKMIVDDKLLFKPTIGELKSPEVSDKILQHYRALELWACVELCDILKCLECGLLNTRLSVAVKPWQLTWVFDDILMGKSVGESFYEHMWEITQGDIEVIIGELGYRLAHSAWSRLGVGFGLGAFRLDDSVGLRTNFERYLSGYVGWGDSVFECWCEALKEHCSHLGRYEQGWCLDIYRLISASSVPYMQSEQMLLHYCNGLKFVDAIAIDVWVYGRCAIASHDETKSPCSDILSGVLDFQINEIQRSQV